MLVPAAESSSQIISQFMLGLLLIKSGSIVINVIVLSSPLPITGRGLHVCSDCTYNSKALHGVHISQCPFEFKR